MKVGFVGLGRMGQAMTRRLLDGGHEVGVYNRTADKLKPLIDLGANRRRRSKRRQASALRYLRCYPMTPHCSTSLNNQAD